MAEDRKTDQPKGLPAHQDGVNKVPTGNTVPQPPPDHDNDSKQLDAEAQAMEKQFGRTPAIGEEVKVQYLYGDSPYVLDVEVTKKCPPAGFGGRVEGIFSDWGDRGELIGGEAFDKLKGKEIEFKNLDIKKQRGR
jgi:hypothetical protein